MACPKADFGASKVDQCLPAALWVAGDSVFKVGQFLLADSRVLKVDQFLLAALWVVEVVSKAGQPLPVALWVVELVSKAGQLLLAALWVVEVVSKAGQPLPVASKVFRVVQFHQGWGPKAVFQGMVSVAAWVMALVVETPVALWIWSTILSPKMIT